MRVVASTDISRAGNDCWIKEEIALVEQFNVYAVISTIKVTGWADREEILILKSTSDYKAAVKKYKDNGGIL
jgi:hypothetical protein